MLDLLLDNALVVAVSVSLMAAVSALAYVFFDGRKVKDR